MRVRTLHYEIVIYVDRVLDSRKRPYFTATATINGQSQLPRSAATTSKAVSLVAENAAISISHSILQSVEPTETSYSLN